MTRQTIFALALLAPLAACGGDPLSGPPRLRLGREGCAECGMLVSEERSSAAMLIERRGRREYLFFDDIGCLLDHAHWNADTLHITSSFVHDHGTRAWVDASAATYLLSDPDRLPTPMASGIAAFEARAAAEKARAEFGGDLLDFGSLIPARRAWMDARYGPREGGP